MYEHPATRDNLERLRARGALVVDPESGRLASAGEWGVGRLAEPETILAVIERALGVERALGSAEAGGPLDGLRVLVTAGGTREPIDSVRYVGNRSSGRMGLALADEAARRGADVTLVAANVTLPAPPRVRLAEVETAAQLLEAARRAFAEADVLLMAAAVADFRPAEAVDEKITKTDRDRLALELEPTVDVLATLAAERAPGQTLIGFAAEHGAGAVERGRAKLERKGLDAVVVNDISRSEIGFDAADNEITIVTAAAERHVPLATKEAVAGAILDELETIRKEAGAPSTVERER
jgi:phosphopantothenoylcysteine decarboxylase/phosphopantothenate--cysteine ligase